jgi:hypothetical protein
MIAMTTTTTSSKGAQSKPKVASSPTRPPAAAKAQAKAAEPKTHAADEPAEETPKPGVILRSYRFSLKSIEWTGTTVGGGAIGSLRLIGLPKGATQKLQNGQKGALRGVTQWSDDVGTKVAHGIGKGKTLAKQGTKEGAKAWARGMKFFITLR